MCNLRAVDVGKIRIRFVENHRQVRAASTIASTGNSCAILDRIAERPFRRLPSACRHREFSATCVGSGTTTSTPPRACRTCATQPQIRVPNNATRL